MFNQFVLFRLGFIEVKFFDIIDILFISMLLYKLYFFVRGSRAAQMFVGLLLIFIISLLTRLFDMRGVTWMFDSLKTVWLIAFVIIFQPELRRMLIYVGQSRLIRYFVKVSSGRTFDEVIKSALELSRRRWGGLIVLPRDTGIKSVAETGVRIQSEVSMPLILSLFSGKSPLHDGAIIVQNDLIEAAKCILPLSQDTKLDASLGTRHRAALGITEETDALVIVVSEETGRISVAKEGRLYSDLGEAHLRNQIYEAFKLADAPATVA
jgi:diadenylate cyclase